MFSTWVSHSSDECVARAKRGLRRYPLKAEHLTPDLRKAHDSLPDHLKVKHLNFIQAFLGK
jgi:hypothetical protein